MKTIGKTVEIRDQLFNDALRAASMAKRSVAEQIEHWSRIGKMVDENPDLPYAFIKPLLMSKQESDSGHVIDYQFG